MIHYHGLFLSDRHEVTRSLNDLLKADAVWIWGIDQEQSFKGKCQQRLFWRSTMSPCLPQRVLMSAAMELAACFYSNISKKGRPSHSALEIAQQQNKDMHKLSRIAWWGMGMREVRPIPVWFGTVQTLNRPQTSRALDQQQGHRQHPNNLLRCHAPSREIDAVQRQDGAFAREDYSRVICSVAESSQRSIRVLNRRRCQPPCPPH